MLLTACYFVGVNVAILGLFMISVAILGFEKRGFGFDVCLWKLLCDRWLCTMVCTIPRPVLPTHIGLWRRTSNEYYLGIVPALHTGSRELKIFGDCARLVSGAQQTVLRISMWCLRE